MHLVLLVPAVLLLACASGPPAPIEDRDRGGTARLEQRYIVLPRDTLYAIAFRYGLDYRRLAAANNIPAPYTIYPGQALQLREASVVRRPLTVSEDKSRESRVSSAPTPTPTARAPSSEVVASSVSPTRPAPRPASDSPGTVAPSAARQNDNVVVNGWLWPAAGPLLRGFDATLHKGIDIGGQRGDAVRATAGGRVVYAGSGIAGHGMMLILRHNDEYLSAYGHNDELLVSEGSTVRAGDAVARRGSSGTDGVKLHFEIRRRGRPIDPRELLRAR